MPAPILRLFVMSVLLLAVCRPVVAARAEGGRTRLDVILAVLRLREHQVSRACLTAMAEVQDTEEKVRSHEKDPGAHPDLNLARDVLASDYQNSAQICGADADRVCREASGTDLADACRILKVEVDQ